MYVYIYTSSSTYESLELSEDKHKMNKERKGETSWNLGPLHGREGERVTTILPDEISQISNALVTMYIGHTSI